MVPDGTRNQIVFSVSAFVIARFMALFSVFVFYFCFSLTMYCFCFLYRFYKSKEKCFCFFNFKTLLVFKCYNL